jgi:hypothetical protein
MVQFVKLSAYELLRPILVDKLAALLSIAGLHQDPSNGREDMELGESIVFSQTGLIYSNKYGFQSPYYNGPEAVANLLLKQLAEMSYFRAIKALVRGPKRLTGSRKIVINAHNRNYFHGIFDSLYYAVMFRGEHLLSNSTQSKLLQNFDRAFDLDLTYDVGDRGEFNLIDCVVQYHRPPIAERARFLHQQLAVSKPLGNGTRIYLARESTVERRVANETQFYELLEKEGFDVVVPEKHSIGEIADIIADARLIVSITGAGLANLIWAEDASILILRPDETWDLYTRISEALNLNVETLNCDRVGPDLHVDLLSFAARIEALESGESCGCL